MPTRKRQPPQEPDGGPADYSMREVAILLGIARPTVYQMKNRWNRYNGAKGGLQTFKNDRGELRVKAEDYEACKAQREAEAQARPVDTLTKQALERSARKLGGWRRALALTPEQMAAPLLAGRENAIKREIDPDGTLEQTNPQEFARRTALAEKIRIERMNRAKLQKRALRETYGSPQA